MNQPNPWARASAQTSPCGETSGVKSVSPTSLPPPGDKGGKLLKICELPLLFLPFFLSCFSLLPCLFSFFFHFSISFFFSFGFWLPVGVTSPFVGSKNLFSTTERVQNQTSFGPLFSRFQSSVSLCFSILFSFLMFMFILCSVLHFFVFFVVKKLWWVLPSNEKQHWIG